MPVQCPKCQTVNRDSAQFCDNCGASLSGNAASTPPSPRQASSKPAPPDSLPEAPSSPPHHQPAPRATRMPRVKPGASFGAWVLFLILTFALSVGVFALLVETADFDDSFPSFLFLTGVIFLIGLIIFLRIARTKVYVGLVTHMEPWTPQQAAPSRTKSLPNLVFNLQRTDKNWQVLKDHQGFLKPVLEIAFRTNKVHGAPLEEGARVIIKGRKRGERIQAKEIWNLSSQDQAAAQTPASQHWGRVIQKTMPRSLPDMRYPGQNKTMEVWEFRLQPTDPSFNQLSRDARGDLLVAVPVEIRARSISGPLQDGDKVAITGQMVKGTLYVCQLVNHSAGGAALVIKENAGIP